MKSNSMYVPTIVIGGGQAGLTTGYYLKKRGLPFLILDASARIGDAWRNRWDSLRLFSPARYCGLPGLRFPMNGAEYPNKDQMADYLEQYARHFDLPVRTRCKVERLCKENGRFVMVANGIRYQADNVVVAMADYQIPKLPGFAGELHSDIVQLHSKEYRNTSQLKPGGVLVVGVGNSGGDIAIDVARTHPTWISGKETGVIPWRLDTFATRHFFSRLISFLGHYVFSVATPIGRKLRPVLLHKGTPLVRVKPSDLKAAGIERVPRVVGVKEGKPLLDDGRTLEVKGVIWCTGFHHTFPWIDLPIFGNDKDGSPVHERGIVPNVPGLYFVGLHFLYAMSSATLVGIARDARWIVKNLALLQRPQIVVRKETEIAKPALAS